MQDIAAAATALIAKNNVDLPALAAAAYSAEEHYSNLCIDLEQLRSELHEAEDAYNRAVSENSPDVWELGQRLEWAEGDVRQMKIECGAADDIAREASDAWRKANDQVSAAHAIVKIFDKDLDLIEVLVNSDLSKVGTTVLDRLNEFGLVDVSNVYPKHPALTKFGQDVVETYNLLIQP